MKKIFYLMLATLMLSSCATGLYLPGKSNFGMNTNVVLSQANYRIVRNLDITVEINNTNLKRVDVEKSAYAELLRQANLTGSQALANVVVEEVRRESTNLFGFTKHVQFVSAHASIIEFLDATGNPTSSVSTYTQPQPAKQVTKVEKEEPTAPVINKEVLEVLAQRHSTIGKSSAGGTQNQIRKYYFKVYDNNKYSGEEMYNIQSIVMQCLSKGDKATKLSADLLKKLKNAENTAAAYQTIFLQEYNKLNSK